jgi:hypothetical protein
MEQECICSFSYNGCGDHFEGRDGSDVLIAAKFL